MTNHDLRPCAVDLIDEAGCECFDHLFGELFTHEATNVICLNDGTQAVYSRITH